MIEYRKSKLEGKAETLETCECHRILRSGEGEIVEKKSRFLAQICFVSSVSQAEQVIKSIRKEHYNARHVCFAYIIEEQPPILRCSDDGEPSGTAGKPMLDILTGNHLTNVLVTCVRYFGGTLLGTGGLVRAYQGAAKEAFLNAKIGSVRLGKRIEIKTSYEENGNVQYLILQHNYEIERTEYTDLVQNYVCIPTTEVEEFKKTVIERTSGRAKIIEMEDVELIE